MTTTPSTVEYRIPSLPVGLKIILSVLILLVGIGGMIGLTALQKKPEEKKDKTLIPLVETFPAVDFKGNLEIEISGQVVPFRETDVSTQVSGIIASKSECCDVGKFVNEGDVLITIDQSNLKLEKQRLNAERQQSEDMLTELQTEMAGAAKDIELATQELALMQAERDRKFGLRGTMPQSTLDQAERNLLTAKKALQSLQNNLSMMKTRVARMQSGIDLVDAMLAKTELDIKRTTIKAPTSGIIVSEPFEKDSYITVGGVVATINDISRVEVKCNLRSDQLSWLLENSDGDNSDPQDVHELPPLPVEITTNAGKNAGLWHGELSRYDGIGLDQVTKMVPVRIDVRKPVVEVVRVVNNLPETEYRRLVPNTYVKVKIAIDVEDSENKKKFLAFPATAVQPGNYVWVVQGGVLKKFDVTIVNQQPKNEETGKPAMVVILVDNELKVGDKVVISPVAQPTIDAQVREVTAS